MSLDVIQHKNKIRYHPYQGNVDLKLANNKPQPYVTSTLKFSSHLQAQGGSVKLDLILLTCLSPLLALRLGLWLYSFLYSELLMLKVDVTNIGSSLLHQSS